MSIPSFDGRVSRVSLLPLTEIKQIVKNCFFSFLFLKIYIILQLLHEKSTNFMINLCLFKINLHYPNAIISVVCLGAKGQTISMVFWNSSQSDIRTICLLPYLNITAAYTEHFWGVWRASYWGLLRQNNKASILRRLCWSAKRSWLSGLSDPLLFLTGITIIQFETAIRWLFWAQSCSKSMSLWSGNSQAQRTNSLNAVRYFPS